MTRARVSKRGSSSTSTGVAAAAAPAEAESAGGNAPIEIVFCFDTTASMSDVIDNVKERVMELTERLLADIAGIRIGILAHGDYGDEPWLMQQLDLSSDAGTLCDFVRNVRNTWGGDDQECYELALHEVRTSFSWRPGTRKRLVMIGDNLPHDVKSKRNKRQLDWRAETRALREELQLSIYSVQADPNDAFAHFWTALADMTGGKHLQLSNFSSIFDFLMAICYLEHGVEFFEAFGEEVRAREEACASDVAAMLSRLEATESSDAARSRAAAAEAAASGADRRRGARRAGVAKSKKASRATPAAKAAVKAAVRARKRPGRSEEPPRSKRESEELRVPAHMRLRGGWSCWRQLAAWQQPAGGARGFRRFGRGWLRSCVKLGAHRAHERVLVEVGVRGERDTDRLSVLYSRFLPHNANNAAAGLMRGNSRLKWHIHRAISQRQRVLMRWTRVHTQPEPSHLKTDAAKVRRQRHLLLKANSYAWNSGRVVRAHTGGLLLSTPPPRLRSMAHFLHTLRRQTREPVDEAR